MHKCKVTRTRPQLTSTQYKGPNVEEHLPASEASNLPTTQVLHSLWVHGGLSRGVGDTPEKETPWKTQLLILQSKQYYYTNTILLVLIYTIN